MPFEPFGRLPNVFGTLTSESLVSLLAGYAVGQTLYFTSNDTFSKADFPGMKAVRVRCQGGGGSGGGAEVTTAGHASAGAGGGGGGYAESLILVDDLADSEIVTVGAGGAGAASGPNNGGAGGDSSFGSHCVGNGGGGGSGGTNQATWGWAYEGAGGGGAGDLVIPGSTGKRGITALATGTTARAVQLGFGGASVLGKDIGDHANSTTGSSGPKGGDYGAGGAGAYQNNAVGTRHSNGGGEGIVIVEVLYERKMASDETPWNGPRGFLDYVEYTANSASTGATELDVMEITVNVPVGRRILVSVRMAYDGSSGGQPLVRLYEDGNLIHFVSRESLSSNRIHTAFSARVLTPTAGSHTYKVTINEGEGTSTVRMRAGVTDPTYILVEDIGPA